MAALNDESATNLIDDPFDDFGRKAGKSVFVGNHSSFDCSALDLSQKPRGPFQFLVEARSDVLEDSVAREGVLEARNLQIEVVFLLFGGHSGLAGIFRFLVWFCTGAAVVDVREAGSLLLVLSILCPDEIKSMCIDDVDKSKPRRDAITARWTCLAVTLK